MQIAIHNHVTYPSSFIFYFLSKDLKDIALIHLDWNDIYVPSVANRFSFFFRWPFYGLAGSVLVSTVCKLLVHPLFYFVLTICIILLFLYSETQCIREE